MAFQVRIRINKNTIKVLGVASSSEEFENFTIGKLKEKALSLFPGVNDPEDLRVIFGQNELKDNQTFESCNIEHLSVLVVVLRMPGGGGPPKPKGNESCRKVSETVGILDWLNVGSSYHQRGAEKGEIQKRDSVPQYTEATAKHYTGATARDSVPQFKGATKPSSISDPVKPDPGPDPDLQFLQSLLPALKRMDLRHRERTKLKIHQLVFEEEFNYTNSSGEGIRRTDSMEKMPPYM